MVEKKSPMERLADLEILIAEMKAAVDRSEKLLQKASEVLEKKLSQ